MIKVAFSVDTRQLKNSNKLNFNKKLSDYNWLNLFSDGKKFREFCSACTDKLEIWVLSSDNVDAINLAATIKKDNPKFVVCLIVGKVTGSLVSRAKAAGIDSVINVESLNERISAFEKQFKTQKKDNSFAINNIPKCTTKTGGNNTFVLSVMSASGGAGKSCTSTMLAVLCQAAGLNTLLIDADFQFGDCSSMLGIENTISMDKLIDDSSQASKLKCVSNLPAILAAPSKPELSEIMIEKIPELINFLKPQYDVVIINTSSYWNELHALMLEKGSKTLFLVDQRPSSINSTKKVFELCSRCGIATGSLNLALNKCSKHALFSSVDISCTLQGLSVFEIMDGGLDVDESFSCGKPFDLIHSRNCFAVSLWSLLEDILPKSLMDAHVKKSSHKTESSLSKNKQFGIFKRRKA